MVRVIFKPWLAVILLAQACSGELQSAPPTSPSGSIKIAVVVLNPEVSMEQPVLEVASCAVPVSVPGGSQHAYVEQDGMGVEVAWDKVSARPLPKGGHEVEFKNLTCVLRNEVEFTPGGTNTSGPLNFKNLALTSGKYQWLLAQGSLAVSDSDPEWMKPLRWTIGATWIPGGKPYPKIKVVDQYLKTHPELGK